MSEIVAEGRVENSPVKPTGLHGLNQIFCVQVTDTKKGIECAREELIEMLKELSDFALEYVWRPIAYAYYWTDDHGEELMSEDDMLRMLLICATACEPTKVIDKLVRYKACLFRQEAKRAKAKK